MMGLLEKHYLFLAICESDYMKTDENFYWQVLGTRICRQMMRDAMINITQPQRVLI